MASFPFASSGWLWGRKIFQFGIPRSLLCLRSNAVIINLLFIALVCFCFADIVEALFHQAGFQTLVNEYAHRRTVNKKEGIDVARIFVQSKFIKPEKTA